MFSEYQTEIFGLIALLIVSVAYLVFKIKVNKKEERTPSNIEGIKEVLTVPQTEEEVIDEYDIPQEIKDEFDEDVNLEGEEEGSFGEVTQESEKEVDTTQEQNKSKIIKREVPSHDKITKENFKEFAGSRILVAEDNLINQKVIQGLLADSGIEIVIADDGQVALDILEKDDNFLLILMDAHMPRVDGFEATRIIRANPKYDHILVVALSGDTAADDIKKMTEAGMQEHLEKPLRMTDLYDILYAYSGDIQRSDEDEIEVIMTKELHGDKGLEVCGGDESLYHEILDDFVKDYGDSAQKLSELLHAHQLDAANKLLLDIVGLSANIGAEPLNKIASEIKLALDDTNEKSYITLLEEYKTHLDALIDDISNYK